MKPESKEVLICFASLRTSLGHEKHAQELGM